MNDLQQHYDKMFSGHETLVEIACTDFVRCWRMERKPGTRAYMVQITSTPEGIAIQGDTIPGHDHHGALTNAGGLAWFVSESDPDYLAGKFLTKTWVREEAEQHIRDLISKLTRMGVEDDNDDAREVAMELRQAARSNPFDDIVSYTKAFGETLTLVIGAGRFTDPLIDFDEAYPSLAYRPSEVAMLSAIQKRFRTLFLERYSIHQGKVIKRGS